MLLGRGYAAQLASGMRVLRISGVDSEAEIAFGVLHLLLGRTPSSQASDRCFRAV